MYRFEGYHIPEVDDRGTSHSPERRAQQYSHATGSEGGWQSSEEIQRHGKAMLESQAQDEQRGREAIALTEQKMRENTIRIANSFIALAKAGQTRAEKEVIITPYQHKEILRHIEFLNNNRSIDARIRTAVRDISYNSQQHVKEATALYEAQRRKK